MALPAGFQTAADLLARTGVHSALPVTPALSSLFPLHGMERGRIYGVRGDAAASLVFALVEGFEIVVVRDPQLAPADARKVAARVKAQGAVLLAHGNLSAFPVDACLTARTDSWRFGACATERTVHVEAEGRRMPAGRTVSLLLPSSSGSAAVP